jgi:RNA polymerase sigma-70 factor (ECF subfamily)
MTSSQDISTSLSLLQQLRGPGVHEEAWRTFLERYRPLLYDWCCSAGLQDDDAEEVIAALLANLVRVMSTFVYDPSRSFRGYLRRATQNEIRNLWREKGRSCHIDDAKFKDLVAPSSVDKLVQELDGTLGRDLEAAQACATRVRKRVAGHTWRAYWLTAVENEDPAVVAQRLSMRVTAVYMAKSRVGKMLREEGAKQRGLAEHTGEPT